jgi:signal transduction histidine kinase
MDLLNEALRWAQYVGFVLVAGWALLRWWRRRDEATRWLAATFASLGLVVSVSALLTFVPQTAVSAAVERLIVAVLVLFPYLLLRFLDSFAPIMRPFRRVVGAGVVGLAAVSLFLTMPEQGAPRSAAFNVFVVLVLASWLAVLPFVGLRFWRAGRGQPTVARRRLRLLAIGSVSLSLAILVAGAVEAPGELSTLVTNAFGLLAAALFLLGFAPPPALRRLWRQPEENELHSAALGLMAATTTEDIAAALLPHLRAVVAARGVALVHDGQLLGSTGVGEDEAAASVAATPPDALTSPLANGAIHVWTDRFTPFFGEDELALFERIGLLADLALDRSALLVSEREARSELELANAELESFVYSASHDLKSPLIAMLGYVDLLMDEHRGQLGEEGGWYLERMAANGRYMEALIRDLLELSRIGRMQTDPDRVELASLLEEAARELEVQHPGLQVEVGELPVLRVNSVRVRQLFTNLLENAATHGESDPTRVIVTAEPHDEEPGGVVVVVRDDGPGIPEAYRELVFGVFERLSPTDDRQGTGIGLAICRKIMESVGGRIWLADRDDGAEFRLLFPASAVLAEAATPTEEVPA